MKLVWIWYRLCHYETKKSITNNVEFYKISFYEVSVTNKALLFRILQSISPGDVSLLFGLLEKIYELSLLG